MGCNKGCGGDGFTEDKWGKGDELDGRNGGRDSTSENLTCTSSTSEQGIVNDGAGEACSSGSDAASDRELKENVVR